MYQLRPYQNAAIDALDVQFIGNRSTLVVMATGLGKTVMFAHVADRWPGRVLVVAHRDELIRQAAEKISAVTGHPCGIEMGRQCAADELYGNKVTVGSVQTLCRANRRHRFHPDHFSLLVIDEGHHATAPIYRRVIDYFTGAKLLLVTATPKRGDNLALGDVCESVAYQYGIEPAINDGWLVPVRQVVVKVDGLDFSKARSVADDFNEIDLERILTEEEPLHRMCASGHEVIGDRPALWFCVTKVHARKVAGVLSRYVSGGVVHLDGDTPKEERRDQVRNFKAGRIQHLVNCRLFLEGFDAPSTAAVVMARPTKSVGLYEQVLGRGTRPLPGIVDDHAEAEARKNAIALSAKPDMIVVDFAGNAGRHKIVQAADVLGGKHGGDVREYAKQTLAEEPTSAVDIEEALERAREELALIAEEDDRRRQIKAAAQYRTYEVDPFVREHATATVARPRTVADPCSSKQAGYIAFLSRKAARRWTFQEASQLSAKQARGVIQRLKQETGQ